MKCTKCSSRDYTRNGIIKGIQRFKCKVCGFNYTVERKTNVTEPGKKRMALILYLEGLKVSTIAQMLDVSHVSVSNWIRKYSNHLDELRADRDAE